MKLLLALVVCLLIAGLVAAESSGSGGSGSSSSSSSKSSGSEGKSEGKSVGKDRGKRRDAVVKVNNNQVQVTSTSKSENLKDRLDFSIKTSGGNLAKGKNGLLDIRFSYYSKSNDTKDGFDYSIRVFSIIEYVDNNATKGFQPTEDTVVQKWTPSSFSSWSLKQIQINGLPVYQFTATGNNIFVVRGEVSGDPITGNATRPSLDPRSVKFDFEVNNFPYLNASSTLALETAIVSKTKVSEGPKEKITAVSISGDGPAIGQFTWIDHVELNNNVATTAAVIPSQLTKDGDDDPDGKVYRTYFTFDTQSHPTAILWDPTVGVAYSESYMITSSSSTVGFSLALVLATVVAAAVAAL